MLFRPPHLPDGVSLVQTALPADGWLPATIHLRIGPQGQAGTLSLMLWNADFSPLLDGNRVTVQHEKDVRVLDRIALNQFFEIRLAGAADKVGRVRITVDKFLPVQDYDPRERAVKLISSQWIT